MAAIQSKLLPVAPVSAVSDDAEGLQAGAELDALIAEKVMGWEIIAASSGYGAQWYTPWNHATGRREYRAEMHWSPSTNIADAWMVVEKMVESGWWISLSHNGNKHAAPWDCRLVSQDEKTRDIAIEMTAPLAICRAALKATSTP